MRPAWRRRPPTAMLMASALVCGACATPAIEASVESPSRLSPAPSETYLSLGNHLLEVREPALAMRAYSSSLAVEGPSVEAFTGAGIAARQQGMLGAARRYFEYARDVAPRSAAVHNNLGVVLLELREYDAARTAFRAALAAGGGDDEQIRRNLARAERAREGQVGAFEQARLAQRVVRLGKDEFRLTAQPESEEELPVEDEAE